MTCILDHKGLNIHFLPMMCHLQNDVIMLRRYADEHNLKHGFRKIRTYCSILKIMLEIMNQATIKIFDISLT